MGNGGERQAGARVALLGTGKMGSAIAERLSAAGFRLVLWNRTRERAEQLGLGRVAGTPAAAVDGVEFVVSSLTDATALREVYEGPSGVLAAAHGQVCVDMSTAGPDVLGELRPQVEQTTSALVDAPIIGSPASVRSGDAIVVAGGSDPAVAAAQPVLEAVGRMRHAGPAGAGARLKLVANSMLGAVTAAVAELQVAGETAGLDGAVVFDTLVHYAPLLEPRRAWYVGTADPPLLFSLHDIRKDMDLALAMFHGAQTTVPVTASVREVFGEAAARGYADSDIAAVAQHYRDVAPR